MYICKALNHKGSRRAFAERLDMTIKRAKVTYGRVISSLDVPEHAVTFWRAGVTVPKSTDCERLSDFLDLDVAWLCASEAQATACHGSCHRTQPRTWYISVLGRLSRRHAGRGRERYFRITPLAGEAVCRPRAL